MMLILTQYIAWHELKPLRRFLSMDELIGGAKKVMKGLGTEIKSPRDLRGFRFFKVRIGKRNAARMIVFVLTDSDKVIPVLIRLKKDKTFGMNMAMNNPRVVAQLNENLDRILTDMTNNAYQEFAC